MANINLKYRGDVRYTIKIRTPKNLYTAHYKGVNSVSKVMLVAQRMVYETLDDSEARRFTVSIVRDE